MAAPGHFQAHCSRGVRPSIRDVPGIQHGDRTGRDRANAARRGGNRHRAGGDRHWEGRSARRWRRGALAGTGGMRVEVRMGGEREVARGQRLAEGKTKVVYTDPADPALAIIVHKDDITAGDGARRDRLPGKGALSGRTTSNVFRLLRAFGIPTHFVDAPAMDEMVVRRCDMIPLEVVMRRIATGSYLKRNDVPEGTQFDPPVIELFFKDDVNHDPLVDAEWIIAHDVATPEEIDRLTETGRRVFEALEATWEKQGVQLVDLKIEFGRDADGNLLVADVIDNDSWRIWPGGRKEALRGVLIKYQQVAALTDGFPEIGAAASTSRTGEDKPREACGVFGIWGEG